jgi:hypothetical protein
MDRIGRFLKKYNLCFVVLIAAMIITAMCTSNANAWSYYDSRTNTWVEDDLTKSMNSHQDMYDSIMNEDYYDSYDYDSI